MNALVVIETLTPSVFAEAGGIDAILEKLEADVRSVATDISTATGRAAVKSLAFKVTRSKTALDDMGKTLVADLKKQTGAIDAERRKIRDRLDALADEVRKPLTDWENIEKDRVSGHEAALEAMLSLSIAASPNETPSDLQACIEKLAALNDREWQEFAQRASITHATAFADISRKHQAAVKREAEAAELTRLRAEQAARELKEREELITAAAAERARIEAERIARIAAEKAASEKRQIEQEKAEALARAERAERDAKLAAEKAEHDRAAAVEAERRRQEEVARKVAAEAAAREANSRHRAKINNAAVAALVAGGLPEDAAKLAVTMIAKKQIPSISITY